MSVLKCLFCCATAVQSLTTRKSSQKRKGQWDSEEQRSSEELESQSIEDTLSFLCKLLLLENLNINGAQFCGNCHPILIQLQNLQIELRKILGIIEDKIHSSAAELDLQESNSSCPSQLTTINDKAFLNIATAFRRTVCENVKKRREYSHLTTTTTSSSALTLPLHVDMSPCILEKKAVLWEQEELSTMKTEIMSDESCKSFDENGMDTEMENISTSSSTTIRFKSIALENLDTSTSSTPVIISTVSLSNKRKRPPRGQRKRIIPFYCRICPYKCTETKAKSEPFWMRRHELAYHYSSEELPHACEICKIKFSIPEILSAHMKTHAKDQETFLCEMCPLELKKDSPVFNSGHALQYHIFVIHIAKPPEPLEEPIPDSTIVKKARVSANEGYSCHLCPRHYSIEIRFKKHLEYHKLKSLPSNLQCEFCSYLSKTLDQLEKHLLWNHENKITEEEKLLKCSYCPRKFVSEIIKTRHEGIRHQDLTETEDLTDSKSMKSITEKMNRLKPKFFCEYCDRSFSNDGKLLIHCTLHCSKNGYTKFKKIICSQSICQGAAGFPTKREFLHHQRFQHSELLIYACPTCDKKYSHENMLNTHLKIHQEEKEGANYHCFVCKSVIQTKDALVEHLAYHNGEDLDNGFTCHICNKFFQKESGLRKHIETTHVDLEDMLKCDECHRKFSTERSLNIHKLKAHPKDDAMTFPCGECDKIFYTNSSLNSHVKCVHRMTEMSICAFCGKLAKCMADHIKRAHEKKRNFECYFCQKMFYNSFELTCHMYLHTGERPFKCDFCNKDFTQQHCLNSHKKKCLLLINHQ